MPLHPLEFVLQLPERLAVDERDSSELLHHLAHGRLGDGADVTHPSLLPSTSNVLNSDPYTVGTPPRPLYGSIPDDAPLLPMFMPPL